jgi:hypothetical protein
MGEVVTKMEYSELGITVVLPKCVFLRSRRRFAEGVLAIRPSTSTNAVNHYKLSGISVREYPVLPIALSIATNMVESTKSMFHVSGGA